MYAPDTSRSAKDKDTSRDLDLFEQGKGAEQAMEALKTQAERFAEQIPERMFSPSDVQGYLLLYKKTPGLAVENVGAWVEEQKGKKAMKSGAKVEEKDEGKI